MKMKADTIVGMPRAFYMNVLSGKAHFVCCELARIVLVLIERLIRGRTKNT